MLNTKRISVNGLKRGSFQMKRKRAGIFYIMPAMIFVLLFFLIPLFQVVRMSFQNFPLLGAHHWVGFQNFIDAFSDSEFLGTIKITLIYTVVVTPLLFFSALFMALLIKGTSKLTIVFRTIFFLPVVIGFGSASFLWYWFVDPRVGPFPEVLRMLHLGTQESPWLSTTSIALLVVILMVVWKFSAFQMILLMAAIQGIPAEILEAAEIDGATGLKQLRLVTLPLIRRTIGLVLILSIAGSLLAFDQFYIITGGGPSGTTITTVFDIYRQSFLQFRLGYGAALSVIVAIVLVAIAFIQLRILRKTDDE